MKHSKHVPWSLQISERLYRTLLWLYPTKLRCTFGREMLQTFRDCYREEQAYGDLWGIARLWSLVVSDLILSVCIEHLKASIILLKSLLGLEEELLMTNILRNLDFAYCTDIGHRDANEDNMLSYVPEDPQIMADRGALFVVADGLGGHRSGEIASELAVNAIRDAYYGDTNEDITIALQQAVEHAHTLIFQKNADVLQKERAASTQKDAGMGTTCVAAVLRDDKVYVANAGDSLIYVIRAGNVLQLAQNHGLIAEQLRKGEITEEEARAKSQSNRMKGQSNVITRCLGLEPNIDIYVASETVQDGDRLVLCTDGLWTLLEEEELRSIVEQYDPQESAQRLIARANENGGPDNITAVVVHVSLAA